MIFLENTELILASKSPRRHELMEKLGHPFRILTADTDESICPCPPERMVSELAKRKAEAVAQMCGTNAWVLGIDTIVVHRGEVFGKPKDAQDARRMLDCLQGDVHEVYTGMHLIDNGTGHTASYVELTKVFVDPISNEEIDAYISTEEPMDKAGAYGIQGMFAAYIARIEGCYYSVMGLPISALRKMLEKMEVESKKTVARHYNKAYFNKGKTKG